MMRNYPMSSSERHIVRWTGRLITALAVTTILFIGATAFASL